MKATTKNDDDDSGQCWEYSLRLITIYYLVVLSNKKSKLTIPTNVWGTFLHTIQPKSKVTLVHGKILLETNEWIDHAWIEIKTPGKPVVCVHWQHGDQIYLRPHFGRDEQRTVRRYTPIQAVSMCRTHETIGPWT
jgi:hypothetical protein